MTTPITPNSKPNVSPPIRHAWTIWNPGHRQALIARMQDGRFNRDSSDGQNANRSRFLFTARLSQCPPPGGWRTWMFLGGRGAGKTRAGAEWVRWSALHAGCRRIALVGPALHDVREVMIGGQSGLANLRGRETRPKYEVSRRRLEFANGAEAFAYSAEDPDSLRGPQFDAAWCDEAAIWPDGLRVWDTLQMGLRIGTFPRAVVTTTPRFVPLIRHLAADPMTAITHAATLDNADNLSPGFVDYIHEAYAGTHLAAQELGGQLIEDQPGAYFRRSDIDAARVSAPPERFDDRVVAIDPPVALGPRANHCGLIAAARTGKQFFVLADASEQGLRPFDWAARAVALANETGARRILAEANQGGEMVRETLLSAGATLPVSLVHASLSKRERIAPVASKYQQGKVSHVGLFARLEDQMCVFGADDFRGSPDRVDALVWALHNLMQNEEGPRIRVL